MIIKDSKDQAHKILAGKKDSLGRWIPGHVCYVMAENVYTFYPYPQTLGETN